MKLEMSFRLKHRTLVTWFVFGLLFVLCGILGVLQYNWIGQVSVADVERRHQSLQADLLRISQDFNNEIASLARAVVQPGLPRDAAEAAARVAQWRSSSPDERLIRGVALAVPQQGDLVLRVLEPQSKAGQETSWPSEWMPFKTRFRERFSRGGWRRGGPDGGPRSPEMHLLDIPLFHHSMSASPRPFDNREAGWLLLDIDPDYAREVVIPELVERYLGSEYLVDVLTRGMSPASIYRSDADSPSVVMNRADASTGILDLPMDAVFPHPEPPRSDGRMPRMQTHMQPDMGRWQIFARHRAGSLEAAVASTRHKNLAVTGAILLMLLTSLVALVQLTRRSQQLARLQMDFVAGVTHELRTPLAVIYGASYNLRGIVARNPEQVEKYGALLQQESGRLRDLVEEVLRFSGAQAGQVIREREPVLIGDLIEQAVESSRNVIQSAHCTIEKNVPPELPAVLGDPVALKHALQNLVSNAAKYGAGSKNWIGVSAAATGAGNSIEIRVSDEGPGIPADEQKHIFDAFFRGRRAIQDQIHGTGLGLNLVKKIVEAHGGTVRVVSEPMKRTEFIVTLPAMAGAMG